MLHLALVFYWYIWFSSKFTAVWYKEVYDVLFLLIQCQLTRSFKPMTNKKTYYTQKLQSYVQRTYVRLRA